MLIAVSANPQTRPHCARARVCTLPTRNGSFLAHFSETCWLCTSFACLLAIRPGTASCGAEHILKFFISNAANCHTLEGTTPWVLACQTAQSLYKRPHVSLARRALLLRQRRLGLTLQQLQVEPGANVDLQNEYPRVKNRITEPRVCWSDFATLDKQVRLRLDA